MISSENTPFFDGKIPIEKTADFENLLSRAENMAAYKPAITVQAMCDVVRADFLAEIEQYKEEGRISPVEYSQLYETVRVHEAAAKPEIFVEEPDDEVAGVVTEESNEPDTIPFPVPA